MRSSSIYTLLAAFWITCLLTHSAYSQTPDPSSEGWQTEAVSSQIQQQLETLLSRTLSGEKTDSLVTDDAQCTQLQIADLQREREDAQVRILRLPERTTPLEADATLQQGFASLISPLVTSTEEGEANAAVRFRMKITRIHIQGELAEARALLFASTNTADGPVQLNATWQTRWKLSDSSSNPILRRLELLAHEEIQLKSKQPWFTDATIDLFDGDQAFQQQMLVGANGWLNRIERFAGSNIYTRHGLAVGDANGDGLDDVYVCQPGGLPNRLFLQQANGRLVDHSSASGVDWLNDTRSALLVDLDNDGDQDLVVGTFVGVFLCRNDGHGVFERAGSLEGVGMDVSSLSAVDFDNDGDLDLHVCVYHSDERMLGNKQEFSNVYDLRSKGGVNRLYANSLKDNQQPSEWKFRDVTFQVGLDDGNSRYSFAAAWEDYDNDGDQDLYIANDFGINCLYRNEGGKFSNVSAELGVEDYGPGMSVAWGDYNRDGRPDIYVANMFSSAGNRVTRQEQFQVDAHGTSRESFHRFNKGNSLYSFNGETFDEIPGAAGAANALWAWSSLLADMDNDGWEDALVANGYITGPGGGDL